MASDSWATRIRQWAKDHGVAIEQEAGAGDAAGTLWVRSPSEPQFRARLSPGSDDEVLVRAHLDVPEGAEDVLIRVSAMRSSLVRWTPIGDTGETEVSVVLFEDGLSKLQLLSAVDEVRKLIDVVGWDLQAAKATDEFLAETNRFLDEARLGLAEADQLLLTETSTTQPSSPPSPPPGTEASLRPAPDSPPELGEGLSSATKSCPRCAQPVKATAKFCPFCGSQFPG